MMVVFVQYLVQQITTVHSTNMIPPDPEPIPNSYNPAQGTAYYFTESGNQLRRMPSYDIEGRGRNNYDDRPEVECPCTKNYPSVFIWVVWIFISLVLPSSWACLWLSFDCMREKRRKDPFSSVFKYMEKAPKHIYYDNACQLSEYCLNREPEFFKHTRFWHNMFHSMGYLCGMNCKSGRILGLAGINSEICEQVNSFLQCIKYTGFHLVTGQLYVLCPILPPLNE